MQQVDVEKFIAHISLWSKVNFTFGIKTDVVSWHSHEVIYDKVGYTRIDGYNQVVDLVFAMKGKEGLGINFDIDRIYKMGENMYMLWQRDMQHCHNVYSLELIA